MGVSRGAEILDICVLNLMIMRFEKGIMGSDFPVKTSKRGTATVAQNIQKPQQLWQHSL
jgi:hypothetical protein